MQKILRIERYAAASLPVAATVRRHALRLLRQLSELMIRNGTRRALVELERHRLLDIGKTPEEAKREAAQPFWRA